MHILVIDDERDFRRLVWWSFSSEDAGVQVTEIDPLVQERPQPGFDWSQFDVLLLDHELGIEQTGLDWLCILQDEGSPPATVLMTDDQSVASAALAMGAAGYLPKTGLSPRRLVGTVNGILEGGGKQPEAKSPRSPVDESAPADKGARRLRVRKSPGDNRVAREIRGYSIRGQIGRGGTSTVYLAEREGDGGLEVLKVIDIKDVDDGTMVERFVQEAELISRLRNTHIVQIYRQGFTDSYAFMSMEPLSGGDLKDRIGAGIPHQEAVRYLRQIAYALDAIHGAGIVHRDLKPSNLMFRDQETLVLADFGIAKRLQTDAALTHVGQVIGTPYYMSPEQARGTPVDERSDIYSVGAIFYEMLTGARPYTGNSPMAMIEQHLNANIPELPRALDRYNPLLRRFMAKDPIARFQRAQDILDAVALIA